MSRSTGVGWDRRSDKKDLIRTYKRDLSRRKPPMQTIVYDLRGRFRTWSMRIYYIDPEACDALHPKDDNKYASVVP